MHRFSTYFKINKKQNSQYFWHVLFILSERQASYVCASQTHTHTFSKIYILSKYWHWSNEPQYSHFPSRNTAPCLVPCGPGKAPQLPATVFHGRYVLWCVMVVFPKAFQFYKNVTSVFNKQAVRYDGRYPINNLFVSCFWIKTTIKHDTLVKAAPQLVRTVHNSLKCWLEGTTPSLSPQHLCEFGQRTLRVS